MDLGLGSGLGLSVVYYTSCGCMVCDHCRGLDALSVALVGVYQPSDFENGEVGEIQPK